MTVEPPATEPVPPDGDDEPRARRRPSTIGGMFYLVVLAATAVGIGIVSTGTGVRASAGSRAG